MKNIKYIYLVFILGFILLITITNVNAFELTELNKTITKSGITVKVIENTDYCGTSCRTLYKVCDVDNLKFTNDLYIKFYDDEYNEKDLIKTINYELENDKDNCRTLEVKGTKKYFDNIDNVLCFDDVCFNEFAWWLSSFPFRFGLNFTNTPPEYTVFAINDTNKFKNNTLFTYKVNEPQFVYCSLQNCSSNITIGTETNSLPWENETSRSGNYSTELYVNGEVLKLNFGENNGSSAYDSTNYNHVCNLYGTYKHDEGIFGYGINFTSDNGLCNISDSSSFDLTSSGTLEVWFQKNGTSDNYGMLIGRISGTSGAVADLSYFLHFDDANHLRACTCDGIGNNCIIGSTVIDNNPHYAVFTWGSGVKYIFLDGVLDGSGAIVNTPVNNALPIVIGKYQANIHFIGMIDNVIISNETKTSLLINMTNWNGINNLSYIGVQENYTIPPPTNLTIINASRNYCSDNKTLIIFNVYQECNGTICINHNYTNPIYCSNECVDECDEYGSCCLPQDYFIYFVIIVFILIIIMITGYLYGR